MSSLKLVFELAEDVLPEGKALTAGVGMLFAFFFPFRGPAG